MFGKQSHVSPLELRKQLLIAESELNRAQLSEEWQTMACGARELAHRAKAIVAWAPSVALLVAGLAALRRRKPAPAAAKPSWFQKILNGARLASTIWLAFRARGDKEEHQPPPTRPEACRVGGGLSPPYFATIMLGLLLLVGSFTSASLLADAPLFPPTGKGEANPAPESPGPTLLLDSGSIHLRAAQTSE
jgi:hypothetical protein